MSARVPRWAEAERTARRSASSTPARAIPFGSTCCRPPRRMPAWTRWARAWARSATPTWRSRFTRMNGKVGGDAGGGRDRDRHLRRRVAAQPRQRGPAARRRPARRLAAAGHRALDRALATGRVPDRRGRGGHRGRWAAEQPRPSGCSWASEQRRGTCIALVVAAALAGRLRLRRAGRARNCRPTPFSALDSRLDEIQRRFDDGATTATSALATDIRRTPSPRSQRPSKGCPENVDTEIRNALERELRATSRTLTQDGCADVGEPADRDRDHARSRPRPRPPRSRPRPRPRQSRPRPRPRRPRPPTPAATRATGRATARVRATATAAAPRRPRTTADGHARRGRRPLRARQAAWARAACPPCSWPPTRVLERPVAIKLLAEHLAEDEDFVARFRREALAAARLQHPNVVQVFDSGEDRASHRHYIVMEYVDGPSCADMLRDQKRLEVDDAVRIVRDACHGLDYAHRAGVVHRDVKPGNLLVARDSGHHQAGRLRDRQGRRADPHHPGGLGARHRRLPLARAGARRGGRPALGHLLARGLRLPVPGRAAAARVLARSPSWRSSSRRRRSSRSPIHRPEVPAELDRAIRVCLAREPAARYASTLEMARALDAGMQGRVTDATPASRPPRPWTIPTPPARWAR